MKKLTASLVLVAITVFATGCTGQSDTAVESTGDTQKKDEHDGHDHAGSDHTMPHGGHLIELGRDHAYHAELVDDHEAVSVTVYIMDGDMKPLAIDSPSILLVLTAADETKTFELVANAPGGASKFTSSDETMMTMIDKKGATGKLRVTIDDKPFTGAFEHHAHEHKGHAH